jgi:hypothetical protein
MAISSKKLLPVCVNDKYGYINLRGEVVVPCQYDFASEFSEGLARIRVVYNQDVDEQEYFLIDDSVRKTSSFTCQSCSHDFSEGLLALKRNGKWGYLDKSAMEAIPPSFQNVGDFIDGLAWASTRLEVQWKLGVIDQPEGIINRRGEWVIPPEYARLLRFRTGQQLSAFMLANNKWGLLDREGRIVVEAKFDSLGWPNGGMLAAGIRVQKQAEKHGIINSAGEWLVEPRWDGTDGGFSEDLMSVAVDGKQRRLDRQWGLVDREGEWVVRPEFTEIGHFSEGLCPVYVGGERDPNEEIFSLFGGKYGFIDKFGEMVIQPRWDIVRDFKDGVCEVHEFDGDPDDGITRKGWIDSQGSYIWEPTR